jgi:hypothetical protein
MGGKLLLALDVKAKAARRLSAIATAILELLLPLPSPQQRS